MKNVGVILISLLLAITAGAQYQLEKFVIGSGGGMSSGGSYSIEITTAQPLAGGYFQSGQYSTYHGFWTPSLLPTAANAFVGGRVRTSGGQGIGNSRVVLRRAMTGETQVSLTNQFGYFHFDAVPVGESYLLSVSHKHHEFESRFISVVDDVSDLEIVAINLEMLK
jgi:hypothetical protein